MRKYALLLTARNKVIHVAAAVKSMYAQVGPPIELLLSDSGSDDGTKTILDDLARSYNGPHKVRRLDCPITDMPGMAGLNAHVGWAMTQTDADVVMQLSADDYDLAQRSELTIKAFEEFNPSMVLGAMYYVNERMEYQGETPAADADRWCTLEDMTKNLTGGSTCQAWTREFWDLVAPLDTVASLDVVLPFLAVLHKGAYLLKTRMHAYRQVHSPHNTGLEGVYNSFAPNDSRRLQVEELIHFQISAGYYCILRKMDALGLRTEDAAVRIANVILDRSASWVNCRQRMSFEKIPPIPFKI